MDVDTAAEAVGAAADITLVVDRRGLIRDVAFGSDELSAELDGSLVGQAWLETVSAESRPKVTALLAEAGSPSAARWRQLNQQSPRGPVPIVYRSLALGEAGRVLVIGRDQRPLAALQARLLEAGQSIERDYARIRQAEARYRLLFQVASEPVLVLEAAGQAIVEANPAAVALLGGTDSRLVGRRFPWGFDPGGTTTLAALLATVRATGRADEVRVRASDGQREFLVAATLFRQDDAAYILVRLAPAGAGGQGAPDAGAGGRLADLLERLPEGFVLTSADGRVISANRAFLELAELATPAQARNESLDRWLGRPGVDLPVLVANLREHGAVRGFATTVRGEYGATADVEIAAVASDDKSGQLFAFALHNVGRRIAAEPRAERQLPRSVEQLMELVGRVPLKELVRETTDVIERLCIEAALQLTHDNRASAAEMLGLSRQSLYLKLRRHGLGDLADDDG